MKILARILIAPFRLLLWIPAIIGFGITISFGCIADFLDNINTKLKGDAI